MLLQMHMSTESRLFSHASPAAPTCVPLPSLPQLFLSNTSWKNLGEGGGDEEIDKLGVNISAHDSCIVGYACKR